MSAESGLTSASELQALTEQLAALALKAGAVILEVYDSPFDVSQKADKSPVTLADQRADDLILEGLKVTAPGIPVISEESYTGDMSAATAQTFFLVDPLDGTKEFVRRNGEFTVNIGLIHNRNPIAGVVYAPALSRLFVATGPDNAFSLDLPPTQTLPTQNERRRLSIRRAGSDALEAVVTRSHPNKKTDEYLNLFRNVRPRAIGSSLKICLVAAGEADLSPRFGPTMEWDTAAAHAVARAAGARLFDARSGVPVFYGKTDQNLVNPGFVVVGDVDPVYSV